MTNIKYYKEFNNIPNNKIGEANLIFDEIVNSLEKSLDNWHDPKLVENVDRVIIPISMINDDKLMFSEHMMVVYPKNGTRDSISRIHTDIIFTLREMNKYPTFL